MAIHNLVALSNPVPGKKAEFRKWYVEQHVADVLRLPGAQSAECFELGAAMGSGSWQWMAVYRFDTDDPAHTLAELQSRVGTNAMPLSDCIDMGSVALFFATPHKPSAA